MRNIKVYSIIMIVFALVQLIMGYYFWSSKERALDKSISNAQQNFISTYNTVFTTYTTVPKVIFDSRINNQYIASLLAEASKANKEYKELLRQDLFKQLKDHYYGPFVEAGFKELHFHLKNKESFLRFSDPDTHSDSILSLRHSIDLVHQNKTAVEGFEAGKYFSGYRYVYPLFFQDKFIGSVGMTLSIDTYLQMAKDALGGEQRFIVKKEFLPEQVNTAAKKEYRRSCLDSAYLFRKKGDKRLFNILETLPASTKKTIQTKLYKKITFSQTFSIKKEDYLLVFLPIFDLQNNINGYIIGMQEVEFIKTIQQSFYRNIFYTISSFFLVLLLLLAYSKQDKLLKQLKRSKENLEKQVASRTKDLEHNVRFLKILFDTLPTPVFYKNMDGIYLACNNAFAKMLDSKIDDIVGKTMEDIFPKDILSLLSESDEILIKSKKQYQFDATLTLSDGEKAHYIVHKNIISSNGAPEGIIAVMLDITERKTYQKDLETAFEQIQLQQKEIEREYEIIQQYTIYSKADTSWQITDVSDGFVAISGYSKQELIGQRHPMLQRKSVDDPIYDEVRKNLLEKKTWEGEFLNYRKDGKKFWTRTKILPELDKENRLIGFVTFSQDISSEALIKELAQKDELTGIFNRKKFNEELKNAISMHKRHQDPTAIILFDIDHFKEINDTHGHLVGDEILKSLAKKVSENIRECDTFARWGGEEFALILPKTNIDEAITTAQKLRQIIRSTDFGINQNVTCSFGVTTFEKDDNNLNLIKRVDDLLYEAKHEGRDRIIHS